MRRLTQPSSIRISAPIRAAAMRATPNRAIPHARFNSTNAQPPSGHTNFYKTFARPVAKVFLMATFTYQLAYWAWVKLEKDEIKAERTAEITDLETQLTALTEQKKTAKGKP